MQTTINHVSFLLITVLLFMSVSALLLCLLQCAGRRGIQFYSFARGESVLLPSNDHTNRLYLQPFLQNLDLSPYLQQRLCLPQSLVSLRKLLLQIFREILPAMKL